MENINNVDMTIVNSNRPVISTIGASLGRKYFKVSAKETYPGFADKLQEVRDNNNRAIFITRSPRRFELRGYDILAQAIRTSQIDGQTRIVFNEGTPEEASAVIVDGMTGGIGVVTDSTVAKAISGEDSNSIFADPVKLKELINQGNRSEVAQLDQLISELKKQREAINSTIAANEKKVSDYIATLRAKAVTTDLGSGVNVPITEA